MPDFVPMTASPEWQRRNLRELITRSDTRLLAGILDQPKRTKAERDTAVRRYRNEIAHMVEAMIWPKG